MNQLGRMIYEIEKTGEVTPAIQCVLDKYRPEHKRTLKAKPDRKWAAVRKIACELAGEKCQECGRYTPLNQGHGHHIQKRSSHPELKYKQSNVIWLCEGCHGQIHEEMERVTR